MLQGPELTVERARGLRKGMSLPEVLLWQVLRARPGGYKFRRQHPAGPYVADFFCHEARLVVEIDSEAHERGDRPARDAVRDRWFEERGFKVLRIAAVEVLRKLEGVVQAVVAAADPPLKGEGDQPRAGGGVSASGGNSGTGMRPRALTPLRQAAPATSPFRGGSREQS